MEYQELAKKNNAELNKLLKEKRNDLRQSRFDLTGSGKRNTASVSQIRKDIARIMTVLNANK